MKCEKSVFDHVSDFYIGFIYIPPIHDLVTQEEATDTFTTLENEIGFRPIHRKEMLYS